MHTPPVPTLILTSLSAEKSVFVLGTIMSWYTPVFGRYPSGSVQIVVEPLGKESVPVNCIAQTFPFFRTFTYSIPDGLLISIMLVVSLLFNEIQRKRKHETNIAINPHFDHAILHGWVFKHRLRNS